MIKKIKFIKIKEKTRELTIMGVTVMVLFLFFSGCSIGKAISNTQINGNAEISEPIVVVENMPEVNLTATNNEGYYYFIVKNYNEHNNVTQIDMKYYIEVLNNTKEEIIIKIYKDNKEIKLENNKSEEFLLEKSNKQTDQYKLEIKYDKTKNTSTEDIMQDIQIKVHSEQAK